MDDFQSSQLKNTNVGRRTYLVTYSQADTTKFPTRESFGNMLEKFFNAGTGKVKVSHWACCMENHQDGGLHYHASLKLTGPKKWFKVKENITKSHNITVNFSDNHNYYIAAYKYVCKEDSNVFHSTGHPDLSDMSSPQTKKSTEAYRLSRKRANNNSAKQNTQPSSTASCSKPKSARRLSNLEVSEFVLKNSVKRDTEIFALAKVRKDEGQTDLANFLLSKSSKALNELIDNTWKMENASHNLHRESLSRIDIIRNKLTEECVANCNKIWLKCALEVLSNNNLHPYVYADAIRRSLSLGRGKHRNILIIGPANCAKTFIIKPLELIYKVFCNPANDKYAWVGADLAEVIILQDFRWSREAITWKDLLLLLEGETVKLPAPKNQFAADVVIDKDTPIFATSKSHIVYTGKFNSTDERETEMMSVRWKVFEFKYQFSEQEQKCVSPCARCFAELTFLGENLELSDL